MIKIPKKRSSNYKAYYKNFLRYLERIFPLRIVFFTLLFFALYLLIPLALAFNYRTIPALVLAVFYALNIALVTYLFKANSVILSRFGAQNESLQEAINILTDQNAKEEQNALAIRDKIGRYNTLKNIIEDLNENLSLDYVANNLANIAFSLLGRNKGHCLLYLMDTKNQKLTLFKTKKEESSLVIKAKEGDIFDCWVLRHTSPLYIEDIKKDFRFDLEKLKNQDLRPIASLIAAPFISENQFLGILRLDNPQPHSYSQDDLRFLLTISDIGAFAIENGQLFAKTQSLAIHDALTSLYTKSYLLERLKEECKRSVRQSRVFSFLMLDIDYFKNYNDEFGHTAGDIVLKGLAQELIDYFFKHNAIIGRFGGEEFCVILPETDKKKALVYAEEFRVRIQQKKVLLRRQETSITVSIGVAAYPVDAVDEMELILKVDRAMYEAKRKGRNRVTASR
ncbi:MAG: sensor domain-containing diguanylate cyclase [Candidatus Omnitrophota bacterium]